MNHSLVGKSGSSVPEKEGEGTDVLIENTAVLLLDNEFTIVDPGWVSISGDKINEVGVCQLK